MDCLFCKIISGDIPSNKIFENDLVYCFLDINPVNKGHVLVIPKNHSSDILEMNKEDMSECIHTAKMIGEKLLDVLNCDGFNIMMNNKPASGQVIFHSHIHVIPRYSDDGLRHWPGTSYDEKEIKEFCEKLKL